MRNPNLLKEARLLKLDDLGFSRWTHTTVVPTGPIGS